MSEEAGKFVLKAPKELLVKLVELNGEDLTEALKELFSYSGVESKTYERESYRFDKSELIGDYLIATYGQACCEWSYIANALLKQGKGIEVYASCNCYDECSYEYYALDEKGTKVAFSLPLENAGEIVQEDEDFIERVSQKAKQWSSMIPEQVKQGAPEFDEVQLDEFLSYCE
ncbi:hypothetical protein ACG1BZ_04925 [Microbulbifer sp. CNSA002]|uniref:hypothetical protein n=1 Tax=Microbulbifer sp. CNSA002 TaxID=3373604 RepID=UPI0039B4776B